MPVGIPGFPSQYKHGHVLAALAILGSGRVSSAFEFVDRNSVSIDEWSCLICGKTFVGFHPGIAQHGQQHIDAIGGEEVVRIIETTSAMVETGNKPIWKLAQACRVVLGDTPEDFARHFIRPPSTKDHR